MVSSKIPKKVRSKDKPKKAKSKSKQKPVKSSSTKISNKIQSDKGKSDPKFSKSQLNRKSSSVISKKSTNSKTSNKISTSSKTKTQTKNKPIEKKPKSNSKVTSKNVVKLFDDMQNDSKCNSMLKRFLTKELLDKLMKKKTKMGSTLIDCIQTGLVNHDSNIGIYAADPDAYHTFADLFNPIIQEYHGFKPSASQPAVDYGDLNKFVDLDPKKEFIISTRVRCGRSLKEIPFNPCMKEQQYKDLEKKISGLLKEIPDEELKGEYHPLLGMNKQEQKKLIDEHFLFKEGDKFLQAGNACRYWPVGRGIFLNKNKTFMVWIGEEDHVRIISMQDGANLKDIFGRMINGVKYLESKCEFVRDKRLGYLTFCPTNLGTTIRASVMIKLPKISSNKESFESTADKLNLQVRGASGEHTDSPDGLYDVSNKRRLGLTEFEAVMEMQKGVLKLIEMEKAQKSER